MPSIDDLRTLASRVLDMQPAPVVRNRLLRDVLEVQLAQGETDRLRMQIAASVHVRALAQEQRPDGGWGAFHSRSAARDQKIASTEVGVERALNLGQEAEQPLVSNAKRYVLSILRGERQLPDRPEKNDRWPTGARLFAASTLALIDPLHAELEQDRALWRQIALATFQSGTYSEEDEALAHASLTGASVRGSYLRINNRYTLNTLGTRRGLLPTSVEAALLEWLWHHPGGIGYLGMPLAEMPEAARSGPFDRWFASLEMMVRLFGHACRHLHHPIEWIWSQAGEDGLWDFGPRAPSSTFLPLSEDWRVTGNRMIDWSTRVLLLGASFVRAIASD